MNGRRRQSSIVEARAVHACLAVLLLACRAAPDQVIAADSPTRPGRAPTDSTWVGHDPAADSTSDVQSDDWAPDASPSEHADGSVPPPVFLHFPDALANLAHGDRQLARLCARRHDDPVADAFCAEDALPVTALADLLKLLDVIPGEYAENRAFSVTGHSTALSKRSVSAINPRVIFVHRATAQAPLLAVAFTRGEALVEIVTRDRTRMELQFYAVAFKLPCSDTEPGCAPGELLTSAFERDWHSVDVYDEEDLANTELDCRVCHQPEGPTTAKLLRMQELSPPWTHWFDMETQGGRALIADYYSVHGSERFAGIPGTLMAKSRGGVVAALVRIGGSRTQPNEFLSTEIEVEVEHSAPGQPVDNRTLGQSQTWQTIYKAAQRAEAIPTPYHDVKVTDPTKLARMRQLYADYLAGRLPLLALPDLRDVLPDDANAVAEMGFAVDERLDDRALLTAACGLCHNALLDQGLSRARFHVDLERLSPAEKQVAIDRLNLPAHNPLAMPPRRIHDLTDSARARLVALLRP